MMQEPSPPSLQDLKLSQGKGGVGHTTTEYHHIRSNKAAISVVLLPIKKLSKLLLISWSRWLLQSKLHRKEFRRIGGLTLSPMTG